MLLMNLDSDLKKLILFCLIEFYQFLEKKDVEKKYEKWSIQDTSEKKVEKDIYKGKKL